jgi:hypothetical protein
MRGIEPPGEEVGAGSRPLLRYRVFGGPVAVDQRLTVFDDGTAQLDERHRSRAPIWIRLEPSELEAVRAGLDEVPGDRWARAPSLARRAGRHLVETLLIWLPGRMRHDGARFELRRDGQVIAGATGDPSLPAVVELLDALRVRVVRSHPR